VVAEAGGRSDPVVRFGASERGAAIVPGGVRFSVWAPAAGRASVQVVAPAAGEHAMEPEGGGVFTCVVDGLSAGADYLIRLDGRPGRPDPVSRHQPGGVHGPSRVVDPAFEWHDAEWPGRQMADLIIYELHVGTFTADGTFDAAIARLDHLVELGVTAIELMPVAEFPGGRNWGYDGVSLYAPSDAYGGPAGLRRLVDAAHTRGLAVVLDVVYNHVGPEGNYLGEFGPYFTDRYHTPWGNALNYDDADSDEVRRFVIDNALYWITDFHIDALRLDAVHAIYDFSARHVLAELADVVHDAGTALGRRALVIAESDLNDPRVVSPRDRGGWGLDAQWSDDYHHALHVALTGERSGYYSDFHGISDLASAIRDRFVYGGRHSAHRRRRHGAPASDLPADHFVVAAQNHDQVGNRAAGERLASLVPIDACRVAATLTLLSPNVPLLFMGEEWAETNPFLYFVSHGDRELLDAVRRGRREEFASFGWAGEVPDPGDQDTFWQSKLEWGKRTARGHSGMLRLYRDLIRLRRDEPLLRPGGAVVDVHADETARWLQMRLGGDSGALLVVASLTPRGGESRVPLVEGKWDLVLATDAVRYDGGGRAEHDGEFLTLPHRSAAVLRSG
jgi:maltooligosyltrehalose trehalohydrolase